VSTRTFSSKVPELLTNVVTTICTISTVSSFANKPANYPFFSSDRSPTTPGRDGAASAGTRCYAGRRESLLTPLTSQPPSRAPTVTQGGGWGSEGYLRLANHGGQPEHAFLDADEAVPAT
jgi:hypothetical protein